MSKVNFDMMIFQYIGVLFLITLSNFTNLEQTICVSYVKHEKKYTHCTHYQIALTRLHFIVMLHNNQ